MSESKTASFDQDLSRLEQIRRSQKSARPKQENPAWMNSHADCDFLLGFIDKLWSEYTRTLGQMDAAEQHVKILQEQRAALEPRAIPFAGVATGVNYEALAEATDPPSAPDEPEPDGYIRWTSWNPGGPEPEHRFEYEFRSREEKREGDGWIPLYAAPVGVRHDQGSQSAVAAEDPAPAPAGAALPPGADEEGAIQESTRKEQEGLLNAVQTVWFRAGLLACRAYMAAFVEQGGDKNIADSIRANWWPSLGEDPGPPRQNTFQELTVGEYGEPGFRVKTREEVSPSIEALPVAQVFLQAHCGWPVPHYSTAKNGGE